MLDAVREAAPLFFDERSGQWMLTRFADVHDALRDRRLGRTYAHLFRAEDLGQPDPDPRWARFHEHERWSLLNLEPPDHTRLRRLVSKVFTPRAVEALRPEVEATARQLLDTCAASTTFDLVADYAQPFSVAVICSLLGVPRADTRALLDWSHAIVKMFELQSTDEVRARADEAAGAFIDYVHSLLAEKRARPDGSLLSELVAAEDDGDQLDEAELTSTAMVLLEAGHEATVNALGNGMLAMLLHPGEWARVVSGEIPARTAVEEMVRWDGPLQLFSRWVLDDGVELAGQSLPVGSRVGMLFGAANRDPRRFERPERFLADRGDAGHLGFGGGIHFCLGAPLARLELEVSVAELARRFGTSLELAEEPVWQRTFVIRGVEALRLASDDPVSLRRGSRTRAEPRGTRRTTGSRSPRGR